MPRYGQVRAKFDKKKPKETSNKTTYQHIITIVLLWPFSLDLDDTRVGQKMTGTYQELPQQSARYEDGQGDTPNYRGYTNPDLQSASFKRIQEELDKQEECMHVVLCFH